MNGLVVRDGAHDILVTGNDFSRTESTGLTATGVADLAVTNNTFALSCFDGIRVDGDSPRAVVKNNIAVDGAAQGVSCGTLPAQTQISVSAEAAPTASVDYNVVHARPGSQPYAWAAPATRPRPRSPPPPDRARTTSTWPSPTPGRTCRIRSTS
ncbi:right-handed parallel beta-helix repeat-containing protein [Kitasatospora sp. NPDC008115]|uniref:right-handed parallel beta-helix repeat-containing protein n=1 Tax=Kitasatospora sp. NPDC008115 TaxID=3364022 RepID=UPI0036F0E08B